jgi:hypothetical protein
MEKPCKKGDLWSIRDVFVITYAWLVAHPNNCPNTFARRSSEANDGMSEKASDAVLRASVRLAQHPCLQRPERMGTRVEELLERIDLQGAREQKSLSVIAVFTL